MAENDAAASLPRGDAHFDDAPVTPTKAKAAMSPPTHAKSKAMSKKKAKPAVINELAFAPPDL